MSSRIVDSPSDLWHVACFDNVAIGQLSASLILAHRGYVQKSRGFS